MSKGQICTARLMKQRWVKAGGRCACRDGTTVGAPYMRLAGEDLGLRGAQKPHKPRRSPKRYHKAPGTATQGLCQQDRNECTVSPYVSICHEIQPGDRVAILNDPASLRFTTFDRLAVTSTLWKVTPHVTLGFAILNAVAADLFPDKTWPASHLRSERGLSVSRD